MLPRLEDPKLESETFFFRFTFLIHSHIMGQWLLIPEAEEMIKARCLIGCTRRHRAGKIFQNIIDGQLDRVVQCTDDIANMDDLADCGVPYLWECEIPLSDDGF